MAEWRIGQQKPDSAKKEALCCACSSAMVPTESLTAHSTVWRRLPLRMAGLLQCRLPPLANLATLHLSG